MQSVTLRHHDWIAKAAINLGGNAGFTYRTFHDRIDSIAAWLADTSGIGEGDRVALLGHACVDVFAVQFACFRLGAIFVPLNIRLAAPELIAILDNCTPKALLHDAAFTTLAGEVATNGSATHVVPISPDSAFAKAAASGQRLERRAEMALHDVATILYTSGTTGLPKGVKVTHAMNLFNTVNVTGLAEITDSSVHLCVLPLFHTAGLNVYANPVFHAGGTVVVMPTFDPEVMLQALGDPSLGVNLLFGVPAQYQFPAQHPNFATTDLSRLTHAGVGGAAAPVSVIEAWQKQGVMLTQGYGMTETGPVVLYLDKVDAARKAGSAGKPAMHVDVRLVDADGQDVADGAVGEIWLRGPSITPGYWNNPEATAAAFANDWLRTGDAATRDHDGYLFIVDRWKDMYISGGENVYPAEVENALSRLPGVAEAAVIGVPSARWGETGRAIVVAHPDTTLSAEDVLAHCAQLLARYKLPQDVVFTDALPRNATGKIHKPTLRDNFGAPAAT
ncbi:MAG: acyl-CoA synthetase [Alphaproteobacteria bacterium]